MFEIVIELTAPHTRADGQAIDKSRWRLFFFAWFYDAGVYGCVSITFPSPVTRSTQNKIIKQKRKAFLHSQCKKKRKTLISPQTTIHKSKKTILFLMAGKVVYSDDISKASS